jgi:Sec-independent protein translocase protein TatA
MNIFGLGPVELLVIVIVALLVVGPEKLPEFGAVIGRFIIDFRRVSDEVKGAFNDALIEPRPTWNGSGAPASSQVYASTPPAAPSEDPETQPEATRPATELDSIGDEDSTKPPQETSDSR